MISITKFAPAAALLAAVIAAPASFATKPAPHVTLAFHYDRAAPAEANYARLQQEARNACAFADSNANLDRVEQVCADKLVGKVVDRFGDTRLAELHGKPTHQASMGSAISGS